MANEVTYLDLVKEGLKEVADLVPALDDAIKKGEAQAKTRDGVIQTINEMCDALQKASDEITSELSGSIMEFNSLGNAREEAVIRGFFDRTAEKCSRRALRNLLHEGRVCGELHKVGDRFGQPFTYDTASGVSFWQNVTTFFTRTNSMHQALDGLVEGEQNYISDMADFLNEVRSRTEEVAEIPWGGDIQALLGKARELVQLMREKRNKLEKQMVELRVQADATRQTLH
jgi:hypothetical protein